MARRTGYIWHERYQWHDTGTHAGYMPAGGYLQPYHNFESPESKSRFAGLVEVSGLLEQLVKIPAEMVSEEDLLRVHTAEHVDRIKALSDESGGDAGDGISPFGRGSYNIARLAAGGTVAATRAVLAGDVDNAYALVRPPGHHARREKGMGYCLFSNIGVAIEWARAHAGVERIAVVDYDVHHGNGTQSIFYADPQVLTVSIHQDNLFPQNSGLLGEQGEGAGEGTCINVPLPAGCGNGAYLEAIKKVVSPALRSFEPDIILVASGFDAGANDPLGRMCLSSTGYRAMTEALLALADEMCKGKIVFSHEGGYSPVYVPFCGLAVLEALSGIRTDVEDPMSPINDSSPAHALTPWQTEIIDKAAVIADELRLS